MPTVSTQLEDGSLLVQRHEIQDDWNTVKNEWIVIDGERSSVRSFSFKNFIYSGEEIKCLLREAGFSDVKVFGSIAGDVYDNTSKRLVAVAKKA